MSPAWACRGSAMRRMSLLGCVWIVLLGGCNEGQDASDSYDAVAGDALLKKAKRTPDLVARAALLHHQLETSEARAGSDRAARRHVHEILAQLATIRIAQAKPAVGKQLQERRAASLRHWLAVDPGDGFTRGQVAYEMGLAGRFEEAWGLLLDGIEATDRTDFEEAALLHFSSALPALQLPLGLEARRKGMAHEARLIEALLRRSRERGVTGEPLLNLLSACAGSHLRLGQLDAATRYLEEWAALDPAAQKVIEMRHRIAAARKK